MSFLSKFDVFKSRVFLRYKNSPSVSSSFGGFISIFTILIQAVLFFGFGQDFFQRSNPNIIEKTLSPADYPIIHVSNSNFTFAFRLENDDVLLENDTSLFYYKFYAHDYEKDKDGIWGFKEQILEVQDCKPEHFSDPNLYYSKNLVSWFCPKFNNNKFGGYWDSSKVGYFMVDVYRCFEGSTNPDNGKQCGSNSLSKEKIDKKLYFSYLYQNVLLNPNNYTTPLSYDFLSDYKMLIDGFMKKDIFYFNEITINTDYGWLIKSKKKSTLIGLEKHTSDILNIEQDASNNAYYRIVLYYSKTQKIFNREYLKLQKLAAEVGGILQVFLLFARLITEYFNNIQIHYDLIGKFISNQEINKFETFYNSFGIKNPSNYQKSEFTQNNESNLVILKNQHNFKNKKANNYFQKDEKETITNSNNLKSETPLKSDNLIKNLKDKHKLPEKKFCSDQSKEENLSQKFVPEEINNKKESEEVNFYNIDKMKMKLKQETNCSNSEFQNKVNMIYDKVKLHKSMLRNDEYYFKSIISFSRFVWISFPCCFDCSNSNLSQFRKALLKTTKDYFNTSISIETIIDGRTILNKIKDVIFTDDQLNLINCSPNKQYENFYSNIFDRYGSLNFNKKDTSNLYNTSFYSIRKTRCYLNEQTETNAIKNIVKNSAVDTLNSKILKLYES